MLQQIDPLRLLGVLLLLGAGLFVGARLSRVGSPPVPFAQPRPRLAGPQLLALRGMLLMTFLGFSTGLAGGLLEGALGESALVTVLHGIYSVCWVPAMLMRSLQGALLAYDATSSFLGEGLGYLGLVLIPIAWFGVFLGLGSALQRGRA